jgi:hypothetical protein
MIKAYCKGCGEHLIIKEWTDGYDEYTGYKKTKKYVVCPKIPNAIPIFLTLGDLAHTCEFVDTNG